MLNRDIFNCTSLKKKMEYDKQNKLISADFFRRDPHFFHHQTKADVKQCKVRTCIR